MRASQVLLVLLLLVVMLGGIGFYTDLSDLTQQAFDFSWWLLFPALGLALLNYLLRFSKWHFFLAELGQKVPAGDSLRVFLAGLSMSVTPGKVGELLKSYLLARTSGVEASKSVPVVVAERLTDLLAVVLLAAWGAYSLGYGVDVILVALALCGAVVVFATWEGGFLWLLDRLSRFPFVKQRRTSLVGLQRSMVALVGWKSMTVGTLISVVAWFAECVSFYLILHGLGVSFSLGNTVFVYSLGTVAGAVTMLPGGLVATEASMVAMLAELFSTPKGAAVASVLLVRLCTLWFAVAVGLLGLASVKKRLGAKKTSDLVDNARHHK
mgnify:CR=1 FL=1